MSQNLSYPQVFLKHPICIVLDNVAWITGGQQVCWWDASITETDDTVWV